MTRRGNGLGTVYWYPKRERWIGQYHDRDGRRRKITAKTRDEAERKIASCLELGGPPLAAPDVVRLPVGGHFVYELRNEAGECIYVGVSSNIFRRLHTHWYNRTKNFGDELASVVIHTLPNRTAAEMRELQLIQLYRPRYNTKGKR